MIITLLRKPLEGTVAENTLKHGCGALNIDATRISTSDSLSGGAYAENPTERGGEDMWTSSREADSNCFRRGGAGVYEQPNGRWPANFILTHKEGCELKGTKKVKGHKGYPNGPGGIWSKEYQENHQKDRSLTDVKTIKDNEAWVGHADKDGKEIVADWDCVEDCPVKELDRQSGIGKSTGGRIGNKGGGGGGKGLKGSYSKGESGFGDTGGASRYFKQFNKKEDN
jgi:hypothetical protein